MIPPIKKSKSSTPIIIDTMMTILYEPIDVFDKVVSIHSNLILLQYIVDIL